MSRNWKKYVYTPRKNSSQATNSLVSPTSSHPWVVFYTLHLELPRKWRSFWRVGLSVRWVWWKNLCKISGSKYADIPCLMWGLYIYAQYMICTSLEYMIWYYMILILYHLNISFKHIIISCPQYVIESLLPTLFLQNPITMEWTKQTLLKFWGWSSHP